MYKYNPVFFQRKMTRNSIKSIELKQNYFEQLPDEVILKVLCLLPIQDLIQCATLSRRLKAICKDFSLWKTTIKSRPFNFLLSFGQIIIQQKQHSAVVTGLVLGIWSCVCRLFYSKELGASKSDGATCDVLKFQVTHGTHANANPE